MKNCDTCNASHKNTAERVIRCGTCVATKDGNTNHRVSEMKASHCDECKHFNDEDVPGAKVCEKNHKPRWYAQKNDNPHDLDWGWKRVCADFVTANW